MIRRLFSRYAKLLNPALTSASAFSSLSHRFLSKNRLSIIYALEYTMLSSLFFALSSLSVAVFAGTEGFGGPCEADRYHLSFGNYELNGDCSAAFYCAANNTCASKGCRRDVYPFGYLGNMTLPPYCASGTFCPDEGDTCLPLVDVGQPCQLSRDGESPGDDRDAVPPLMQSPFLPSR